MIFCATTLLASAVCGQADHAKPEKTAPRTDRLAEMRSVVDGLAMYELVDGRRRRAALVGKPLLHFIDKVREHQDGTFWIWGQTGRPVATTEVWSNEPRGHQWYLALASTTVHRAVCEFDKTVQWMPTAPGLQFAPLPGSAPPHTLQRLRLAQMRKLARRFSPFNSGLRLLTQPVHRYQDPDAGILDGAVFVFAHETNPEIVLFIEATEQTEQTEWRFAFSASSSAELQVSLDGDPIWKRPAAEPVGGGPEQRYWIVARTAAPVVEGAQP